MEAIEQYFHVVMFVFQFFKTKSQDFFLSFDLSNLRSERVNELIRDAKCFLETSTHLKGNIAILI